MTLLPYFGRGYLIQSLYVGKEFRHQYYATVLMEAVCAKADIEQVSLFLEIRPTGEMSAEQLDQWFKRYGFETEGTGWYVRKPHISTGNT